MRLQTINSPPGRQFARPLIIEAAAGARAAVRAALERREWLARHDQELADITRRNQCPK